MAPDDLTTRFVTCWPRDEREVLAEAERNIKRTMACLPGSRACRLGRIRSASSLELVQPGTRSEAPSRIAGTSLAGRSRRIDLLQ